VIPALAIGIALAIVLAVIWSRYTRLKRDRYIRDYRCPRASTSACASAARNSK
jgi:hypothetical protein